MQLASAVEKQQIAFSVFFSLFLSLALSLVLRFRELLFSLFSLFSSLFSSLFCSFSYFFVVMFSGKYDLEISNCFPFPNASAQTMFAEEEDEAEAGTDYQIEMMRCLREVNIDAYTVGWYQTAGERSWRLIVVV